MALIEQDYLRRIVLKERDVPGGTGIELISMAARFPLDRGWHMFLEGIMPGERYAGMLGDLRDDHLGRSLFYYLDVSWDETLRRHQTRPQADEFGVGEMRSWYCPQDQLGFAEERIIPQAQAPDESMRRILHERFGD